MLKEGDEIMSEVWMEYFHKTFAEGETWGELEPQSIDTALYGIGVMSVGDSGYKHSPKIILPSADMIRIKIKYALAYDPNTTGTQKVGILFLKDDTALLDQNGIDYQVITQGTTSGNTTEYYHHELEFLYEYRTKKLIMKLDGLTLEETNYEENPQAVKIVARTIDSSPNSSGVIIYDVYIEYTSTWVNMVNTLMLITIPIMLIMLLVTIIPSILKALKREKKEVK